MCLEQKLSRGSVGSASKDCEWVYVQLSNVVLHGYHTALLISGPGLLSQQSI